MPLLLQPCCPWPHRVGSARTPYLSPRTLTQHCCRQQNPCFCPGLPCMGLPWPVPWSLVHDMAHVSNSFKSLPGQLRTLHMGSGLAAAHPFLGYLKLIRAHMSQHPRAISTQLLPNSCDGLGCSGTEHCPAVAPPPPSSAVTLVCSHSYVGIQGPSWHCA